MNNTQKILKMAIPYLPPNYEAILKINPQYLVNKADISLVEPILTNLLYADLAQIKNADYIAQLYQITQLLQVTGQYLLIAQDTFADQADLLSQKCDALSALSLSQQNQISQLKQDLANKQQEQQPTPAFVQQSYQLQKENERLRIENERLKSNMQNCAPLIKMLKKCDYCQKAFVDIVCLGEHVKRRHFSMYNHWCLFNQQTAQQQITQNTQLIQKPELNIPRPTKQQLDMSIAQPQPSYETTFNELDELRRQVESRESTQKLLILPPPSPKQVEKRNSVEQEIDANKYQNILKLTPKRLNEFKNDSPERSEKHETIKISEARSPVLERKQSINEPVQERKSLEPDLKQKINELKQLTQEFNDSFSIYEHSEVKPIPDDSFEVESNIFGVGRNEPVVISFNQSVNSDLADQVNGMLQNMNSMSTI
ncbi:Conserved_hypothetical protein [Hexamita inflata]|uniref:C2H2-type domain-containing protein n=1 Tax=Hexamita inflata TaxID=28002 RepID=A0AA86NNA3_9EUKA|nr:Conserved hypothetical protein [Hexamita inflata]